jgi:hypothetical protein
VLDLCGCVDEQTCTHHHNNGASNESTEENEESTRQLLHEALGRRHETKADGRGQRPTQPMGLQVDQAAGYPQNTSHSSQDSTAVTFRSLSLVF